MRLKVPITGTVLDFDPEAAKLDNIGISGHPDNPVSIAIDIGNVSWRLVGIDLVNDLAEIEVSPGHNVSEPDLATDGEQKVDKDGNPLYKTRAATTLEEQGFLDNAQNIVAKYTVDPAKKLVKSDDAVKKYTDWVSKSKG